ncbi:unnamed protein product [Cuscuta campestris]|uniref:Reverse transcriptase Ty1/copia-type domain-containing protein n=1 Tax=Cuscuta campestris TaxID=132261 RepID=A0A484M6N3_9ASTE|nr:unnamed protein product [Cuscuta campestris]
MSNSKKGSLPMTPSMVLSKNQSPSTPKEKELMMNIPYASAIGSIIAFSWKSFKEDIAADLTTKAEYIVAAKAAKEVVWMKKFITELGVVFSINDPIPLFYDNTRAISQAKEPRSHQKTKHIVRRYHIKREILDIGDVIICNVDTDENIADPLTKPLEKLKHEGHTRSMGIRPMQDWP